MELPAASTTIREEVLKLLSLEWIRSFGFYVTDKT